LVEFLYSRIGLLQELSTEKHTDHSNQLDDLFRGTSFCQGKRIQMVFNVGEREECIKERHTVVDGFRRELEVLTHLTHPVNYNSPLLNILGCRVIDSTCVLSEDQLIQNLVQWNLHWHCSPMRFDPLNLRV
jgi:hypothetical protein